MTSHTRPFPVCPSDADLGALCRRMVAAGDTGSLLLTDPSTGKVHMTVRDVEHMAKFSVRESDTRGPHFVKFRPFPGRDVVAP